MNRSPWLTELNHDRINQILSGKKKCDLAIIGAGIAGVTTAYFALKNTTISQVVLLDAGKMAHGATGHNAGQVSAYFERPIHSIAAQYGEKMAAQAQNNLRDAWNLLPQILTDLKIDMLPEYCDGFAALSTVEQLLEHLENAKICRNNNAWYDQISVVPSVKSQIPTQYDGLYHDIAPDTLQKYLETDGEYIGLLKSEKACINSALFCEKIVEKLIKTYKSRFAIYEESAVQTIATYPNHQTICGEKFALTASDTVLCTNGFEHLKIIDGTDNQNKVTNTHFHESITGLIGYMSGRVYTTRFASTAVSFFEQNLESANEAEVYYYLTRRTFDGHKSLVVVGGPEQVLSEKIRYDILAPATIEYAAIDEFFAHTHYRNLHVVEKYYWHGLMGFTNTGLRIIGSDTHYAHLWYNIGCNGVGILTSIFGSWKISQLLAGNIFEKSVFDPGTESMPL